MSTPTEKLAESIGHQCQTGHDTLADVVLVQLATGETDILCQPCLVAMMTAVIEQVAAGVPDTTAQDTIAEVDAAMEAARVALAAE